MKHDQIPIITLDGPSGTGKGTLCYKLAAHLGWHVLDSGAIYRVLAYAAKLNKLSLEDVPALVTLAESLNLRFETAPWQTNQVLLDNKNVFEEIRTEQCGQDASKLAVLVDVRAALLQRQRDFAQLPGLVTDGRDMGTVVFPDACLKIYLFASEKERATRRYFQLKEKGIDVSLAKVVDELAKRDARDTQRSQSPLKPAVDAALIDTTGLTIAQVFENVLILINEHLHF